MAIINPFTQSRQAPFTSKIPKAVNLNTANPAQLAERERLLGTLSPDQVLSTQGQTQAPPIGQGSVPAPPVVQPDRTLTPPTQQAPAPTQAPALAPAIPQPTEPVDFRTLGRGVNDGRTSEFKNGLGASTLESTPQDNILQSIFDTIQEQNVSNDTILGKFSERQDEAKKATEAAQSLIEQQFQEDEESARKLGGQEVTQAQESRRGFATNSAFLRNVEERGTKRIKDLESQRDQKLALNDALGAERLDGLLFEEQKNITDARVQSLTNMFNLLGAAQSVAGFETPAETREANLTNALTLFSQQSAIGQQFDDRATVNTLKTQFANVEGIDGANNLAEIIGFIGPQIAEDRNLQNQVLQAQIASQQASTQNALNSAGTRELPAGQVLNLSNAKFLPGLLDKLETTMSDNSNLIGFLEGRVLISEKRAIIKAELARVAQLVGKFMEGGVLRKEDETKYRKMLPQLSDQNINVSMAKLQGVRDMLGMQYNENLTDFAGSGFDVSGFQPISFKKGGGNFTTTVQGTNYTFPTQEALDSFNAQVGQQ